MSEKRFIVDDDGIYDTQEKKHFKFIAYDWIDCDIYECCDKLNEQQATIEQLRQSQDVKEFSALFNQSIALQREIKDLKEENKELRKKLECCEYENFKKELGKIHEKVEKGDVSDFGTLTISDKGLEHWNGVLK